VLFSSIAKAKIFRQNYLINLFSGDTPAQAGERLGEALIVNLSDDKSYYVDVAKDSVSALVSAHHALFGLYPDLTDLLLYLSETDRINELADKVIALSQIDYKEKQKLEAGLKRITQLLTNTKKDTLGSVNTALTPLTTSTAGELLVANPLENAKVWTVEEMLAEPLLIRLALPVAENPRIAPIIGRIILTQFNFAVLSPNCNREILKIAAVDEAHNFITASIAKGMAQARSNNAGFMLALQTLSQIPDDSVLDTIFAASGNKLVMAGVGDKDALRFSKTYGEIELPYITHSRSQGTSSSTTSGTSSGSSRQFGGESNLTGGNTNSNTSTTTNNTKNKSTNTQLKFRALFSPAEIRGLPQYHAIIESSDAFGQRWSPMLLDMNSSTLTQIRAKVKAEKENKQKPKKANKGEVAGNAVLTGESAPTVETTPKATLLSTRRPLLQVVKVQGAADEKTFAQSELVPVPPPTNVTKPNQTIPETYPTNPTGAGTSGFFGED
jgi:TraM recognition site of TraD and TraG